MNEVLGYLPNLLAAGLILVVGWFLAGLVQRIVTNLLAAVGLDRVSQTAGLARVIGATKMSSVVGTVVYILILDPRIDLRPQCAGARSGHPARK